MFELLVSQFGIIPSKYKVTQITHRASKTFKPFKKRVRGYFGAGLVYQTVILLVSDLWHLKPAPQKRQSVPCLAQGQALTLFDYFAGVEYKGR